MKQGKFFIYISSLLFAILFSANGYGNESIEINGDGNVTGSGNTTGDNNQVYKQECQDGATCHFYDSQPPPSRDQQDIPHERNLSPVDGQDEGFTVKMPSTPTESLLKRREFD